MEEVLNNIIYNAGVMGPVIACLLIVSESMIPILPLCVFITFNFMVFGKLVGFIISFLCTILGCNISYFIFRKLKNKIPDKIKSNKQYIKLLKIIENISYKNLVLLIAMPFTPAFLINIVCGISNIRYKKYLGALFLGKIFMVYFWGFIGVTFVECFNDPMLLIRVGGLLIIAYILSYYVEKILKIR